MLGKIGASVGNVVKKGKLLIAAKKGKVLCTAKAAAASPVFAVVVLGGIVGWQIWKGNKDAQEAAAEQTS